MNLAPVSSAWYSRERETAIWIIMAAIGARISISSAPIPPPRRSSLIAAPEENSEAQAGNRAGDGGCDRTDQNVAVVHVSEFMRQHAFEFLVVKQVQNPGGDGDRGMVRVAAGGESIWRIGWESRKSSASECPFSGFSRSTIA